MPWAIGPFAKTTGIVTVFVKVGMQVQWEGDMSLTDMINQGVREAYLLPDNILRASILSDPDGARTNTGDNTPAVIHYEIVPGDKVAIDVAAKGGGSEAKSKFAMLKPLRLPLLIGCLKWYLLWVRVGAHQVF